MKIRLMGVVNVESDGVMGRGGEGARGANSSGLRAQGEERRYSVSGNR